MFLHLLTGNHNLAIRFINNHNNAVVHIKVRLICKVKRHTRAKNTHIRYTTRLIDNNTRNSNRINSSLLNTNRVLTSLFNNEKGLDSRQIQNIGRNTNHVNRYTMYTGRVHHVIGPYNRVNSVNIRNVRLLFNLKLKRLVNRQEHSFRPYQDSNLNRHNISFHHRLIHTLIRRVQYRHILLLITMVNRFNVLRVIKRRNRRIFTRQLQGCSNHMMFTKSYTLSNVNFKHSHPVRLAINTRHIRRLVTSHSFRQSRIKAVPLVRVHRHRFRILRVQRQIPTYNRIRPNRRTKGRRRTSRSSSKSRITNRTFSITNGRFPRNIRHTYLPSLINKVIKVVTMATTLKSTSS